MPKLKAISGKLAGKEFPMGTKPMLLGRRAGNAIVVDHNKVSRSHAEVGLRNDTAYVKDLESSNGTFLNAIRLPGGQVRSLNPGDEIRVGDTLFRYFDLDTSVPAINIPGHTLTEVLAEGGMGTIYKAKQTSMGRDVAIKLLHPDYAARKEFVSRFIQEARSAGKLNHPHIIQVHNVGKADTGEYYFSMELVHGANLAQRMANPDDLNLLKILNAGACVADALAYAHEKEIIHRDIKPENIVIADTGEVKLADLGIAKTRDIQEDDRRKRVLGTPHYMSPEQACGRPVDPRSDLYSLGATLYHVLSGAPLFDSSKSTAVMTMHVKKTPRPLKEACPNLSDEICAVIDKLLKKDPAKRFQTAEAVKDALNELIRAEKAKAADAGKPKKTGPRVKATRQAAPIKMSAPPEPAAEPPNQLAQYAIVGGVALVIAVVALILSASPSQTQVRQQNNQSNQTQALEEVASIAAMTDLDLAKIKLELILESTSDLAVQEKAADALGRIRRVLNARKAKADRAKQLKAAWRNFESIARENPKPFGRMMDMLEQIETNHPDQTTRLAIERKRIQTQQADALVNVKDEIEGLIRNKNIDGVAARIQKFGTDFPDHQNAAALAALQTKANETASAALTKAKADIGEARQKKRYNLALNLVAEFSRQYKYQKGATELNGLQSVIQAEADKDYDDLEGRVTEAVKKLDFLAAENHISGATLVFIGTDAMKKITPLEKKVKGIEALHIHVLKQMKAGKGWRVPKDSEIEELAGKVVVSADNTHIRIQLGIAQTKIRWDKLSGPSIAKVYKRYAARGGEPLQQSAEVFEAMFE